jgi:hypothetical protein
MASVGLAAGIAAAFNAPIAAITFTLEELIADLDQTMLSGVIVAAALAAVVSRSIHSSFRQHVWRPRAKVGLSDLRQPQIQTYKRTVFHVWCSDPSLIENFRGSILRADACYPLDVTNASSPIGDIDGQLFAPPPHNPARSSVTVAKKVKVEPAFADAQVTDLKKGEEVRQPWIHDLELSAGRVRF